MQAHKSHTGKRFEYLTTSLSHYGMLRAWSADSLNEARWCRAHMSRVFACTRVITAQKWRIKAEAIAKEHRP